MDNVGNYNGNQWSIEDPIDLDSFRIEDINQINQALVNFHRIKPQLPVEQRDINRFKTFGRLQDFVDEVMDGKEIDKPETDSDVLKRSDVEVIYNGPLGTVTIPKSFEASCELGSGTRWCTTGNNDEYFDMYSRQGDLIIYNEKPGNQKYQIHPTFDQIEIRDARDVTVTADKYAEFTQSHPVLSKLIKSKEQESFNKKAQADGQWDQSLYPDEMDQEVEIVHDLIDANKKHRVGIMNYVETYYTQAFFKELESSWYFGDPKFNRRPIDKYELDHMVNYAEQRGKPWPELQQQVVAYIQRRYAELPTDDTVVNPGINRTPKQALDKFKTEEAKQLLILIQQFKRLKNPWPELDAIQGKLQGKGISFGPGDMLPWTRIESLNLSDIKSDYGVIELSEQIFRRSGRMYFTTRHADERRKDRGITDSKVETAISMLEQDLDWLIYMGMHGYKQGDGLSVFDPKSNLTLVVTYKRPPLDPVTKTPVEVDPDQPDAITIMTIYHGSPITSNRIPKLLKRNGFTDKLGDPVELKTDNVKKRSEYTGPKQFFHLQKGITNT